jgi:hypothetical protein
MRYPARAGFDQLTGYGRLHAERAVIAAARGEIPPRVDLWGPRWFAIVSPERTPRLPVEGSIRIPRARSATYRLEYALGVEPAESDYRLVAAGSVSAAREGPLGTLIFERLPRPAGSRPAGRADRDRYSVTLRLRAVDDRGRVGEARRSFFVLHDPSWKPGFPVDLDASGEAAPLLVDLDDDGRDEIVLPAADGYVHLLHVEPEGLRASRLPLDALAPLDPSEPGAPIREPVIRAAALGDLGDGARTLVVASREGKVHAFDVRGERRAGFPVALDPGLARPATRERRVSPGVLSRPVLADLDGVPGAEIVVSGLDGHVHVLRGDGRPLAGFPVALAHRAHPELRAEIVSTPAVGDLDGDGRPEIVVGWNGLVEDRAGVFVIRAAGARAGAFLPGWDPFEIVALRPDMLPTLATGVAMEPVLTDVDRDGDAEAVLYAVTGDAIELVDHGPDGPRVVARHGMAPGPRSEFRDISFVAETGSPIVADTDGDGRAELYAGLLPLRMLTLRSKPAVPIDVPLALGGWELGGAGDGARVPMLPHWPQRMEDLMIFARPLAADVDGDGTGEVLMGSGGYLLHAFRRTGGDAEGFPKFTGGWIFSEPAVGDLDGDGRLDLVSVTREGYLFAWELPGAPRRAPRRGARRRAGTSADGSARCRRRARRSSAGPTR